MAFDLGGRSHPVTELPDMNVKGVNQLIGHDTNFFLGVFLGHWE